MAGQAVENTYAAIMEHRPGTSAREVFNVYGRAHRGADQVDVDLGWCGESHAVGLVAKAVTGTQGQFDTAAAASDWGQPYTALSTARKARLFVDVGSQGERLGY